MELTELLESGLLTLIILKYQKSVEKCSKRLEYEESTNTLAQLQGELSACKLFLDTFGNTFSSNERYNTLIPTEENLPDFKKATDKTIARLEYQRIELEKDFSFEELQKSLDHQIEEKKEWLFSFAEKGRDLVFVHGWRDGLKKHSDLCDEIKLEYEWRVEQNQLFPEDLKLEAAE